MQQRTVIYSSPGEVEDPCGDLEILPPSNLFSSIIYEPKKTFGQNQSLAPIKPSVTVFSAQDQHLNFRELSSPIPEEILTSALPVGNSRSSEPEVAWREVDTSRLSLESEDRQSERMTRPTQLAWIHPLKIVPEQRRTLSLPIVLQQSQANLSEFLTSPVPHDCVIHCYIRRNRSSLRHMFPVYYMHSSEDQRFLLAAKKRPRNKTSNYLITMNEAELNVNSTGYLGKLRANFLGTEFNIYGKGSNPCSRKTAPATNREDMGLVLYCANVLGQKGQRKMRVAIPALDAEGKRVAWRPANVRPKQKEQTLASQFKQGNFADMLTYFSKPPVWNEGPFYIDSHSFVFDFDGRVEKNSVKNFQLIDNQDEKHIYLQFFRAERDLFTLDFQWPLSPMQAFGLALSSLDNKIVFE